MTFKFNIPLLGAVLGLSLSCGGALAGTQNWCRVEPGAIASMRHKLDLQSVLKPREISRPRVAARRPAVRLGRTERPAAPLAWTPPQKQIELASCAGGHASILCPGYQLVGLEY